VTLDLSIMRDASSWEKPATLKHYLGQQLKRGRLALILGAGASFGFGLPDWRKLVDDMFDEAGKVPPPDLSPPDASDSLYVDILARDDVRLVEILHKALYRKFDSRINILRQSELLTGLAALLVRSVRGHASRVISFNFDDVLEQFLKYFGLTVHSIAAMPSWGSAADVKVYHPHGFTPQDGKGRSDRVVFTKLQLERVVDDFAKWEALLLETLSRHTCVFIGLSGEDPHLSSLLSKVDPIHVAKSQGEAFWGVRFGDRTDTNSRKWSHRGVFPVILDDYSELPSWLFETCQEAAKQT
jgi:SIR2-like domain